VIAGWEEAMKLVDFHETLYRELQDDEFAQAYPDDALSESREEFEIALRHCIEARSGSRS
jgi:DNA-binding phage protein